MRRAKFHTSVVYEMQRFASSATSVLQQDTCFIGEIGLGGELRPVQQLSRRIQVTKEEHVFVLRPIVIWMKGSPQTEGGRVGSGICGLGI